jgi:prepilin-type N-terminal cleavage/methylation domain-containing protein
MKKAFTLIELLISISILAILMLFLYKSYADINRSNKTYAEAVEKLSTKELLKKTLYLDLLMASKKRIIIQNIAKDFDLISFETKNSLHRRINPYVCYLVKEKQLYRLESLRQITSIDLNRDIEFDVDKLPKVEKFRLFGTRDNKKEFYLLHVQFKDQEEILFKIKVLN